MIIFAPVETDSNKFSKFWFIVMVGHLFICVFPRAAAVETIIINFLQENHQIISVPVP